MYRGDERYGQQPQQDQFKRRYDEMNYDVSRDNRRNTDHRSDDYDMNQGRQTGERDTTLGLREEQGYKNKMAEELKIREQQLAMTSNLLEKQSMMLKSLEANMLVQNSMLQRSVPINNMVPVGNTGPMGISSHISPMGNMGSMGNKMRNMGNNPNMGNNMGFIGNINPEFQRSRKPPQDDPPAKRYKSDEFQYESRRDRGFSNERNRDAIIKQSSMQKKGDVKLCNFCKRPGHFQRNCPELMSKSGPNFRGEGLVSESLKTCNYCRRFGHVARTCPDKLKNKPPTKKQRNDNVLINLHGDWKSSVIKGSNFNRNGSRSTVSSSSTSSKTRTDSRSAVSSSSFSNKTSPVRNKNFKINDSKSVSKKDKWNSKTIQHCKVCNGPVFDWSKHIKESEHKRKSDLLRTGCKICHKFRYNSMNQYRNHHDTSLHKALISIQKQVTESKIKAFSSKIATGVDYVAPVTGYFCKLCKKFYNKETYAKVQHCQTKAHYDRVAALIGAEYETAIGAKYAEIREKVMKEHKVPSDRQLMDAIKKADFITGIKPLPPVVKTLKKDTKKDDAEKGDNKAEDDVILIAAEKDDDAVKIIDDPSRSKLASVGEKINETPVIKSGESDLEEHPDDLENMEVLDEANDENDLVIADDGDEEEIEGCETEGDEKNDGGEKAAELEDRIYEDNKTIQHIEIEDAVLIKDDDNEETVDTDEILFEDEDGTDEILFEDEDGTDQVMFVKEEDGTDNVVSEKEDGTNKVVLDIEDSTDEILLDDEDGTDEILLDDEDGTDKVVLENDDTDKIMLDIEDGTDQVVFVKDDDGTDQVVSEKDDDTDQVMFVKEEDGTDQVVSEKDDDGTDQVMFVKEEDGTDQFVSEKDDDTDQVMFVKEAEKEEKKEVIATTKRVLRKKVSKAI